MENTANFFGNLKLPVYQGVSASMEEVLKVWSSVMLDFILYLFSKTSLYQLFQIIKIISQL
jgi:hypothetical protein